MRAVLARVGSVGLVALMTAWLIEAPAAGRQQPTFSTKIEAVRVDVLVTANKKPVTGLTLPDFEVFDNGVRQQVDLASYEQLPLNVVLAPDVSESVVDVRLDHLRRASLAALAGLRGQDRAALVTFNQRATLQAPLTEQLERVRQAVERMEGGGGTALLDATYAGILVGESDMGRSLLMVFTDGADTSSFLTREAVLDSARRTDVVVYAVASGVGKRRSVLDDTVRQTGGALLELESTADMPAAFGRILEEFRQRYLLSYSPTGVERPGWHRIEVRVKGRRVEVKARQGYQVGGRRV